LFLGHSVESKEIGRHKLQCFRLLGRGNVVYSKLTREVTECKSGMCTFDMIPVSEQAQGGYWYCSDLLTQTHQYQHCTLTFPQRLTRYTIYTFT